MNLVSFRKLLEKSLDIIQSDADLIKSDDIVDDDACDNITRLAQEIAEAFNGVAFQLGVPPIEVPADNEVSPYQDDDNTEVEIPGGVMAWDKEDGEIRFVDDHGNSGDVWKPGDEDYDDIKTKYFPDLEMNDDGMDNADDTGC